MSEAGARPLAGRGIVVTRPVHQAAHLAELIRAAGGNPILFPVIEIAEVEDPQPLLMLIERLDQFDMAIFISPNAVERALNVIRSRREFPAHLAVAAIGRAGVDALKRCGVTSIIAPTRFDSEALLELPEMQTIAGKRIVIFRGAGGRELLGDTLRARGATVEYAECYRRIRPRLDPMPLRERSARGELHAVTVTSSEGLRNLWDLAAPSGTSWLQETPVFVPHPRIEKTARELGFHQVVLTAQGDGGLIEGLIAWFARCS